MGDLTRNFSKSEMRCNHCGELKIDARIVHVVQRLRDELNIPLRINSAYRCPEWNKKNNGAPKSQHMEGKAIDVSDPSGKLKGKDLWVTVKKLLDIGELSDLGYVMEYPNFLHMDVREPRTNPIWHKMP